MDDADVDVEGEQVSSLRVGQFLGPRVPGYNVDVVDVLAGAHEAALIGYGSAQEQMVVEYALQRWAHGEEDGAMRTLREYGIDTTSAYRIVAAARGEAARTAVPATRLG